MKLPTLIEKLAEDGPSPKRKVIIFLAISTTLLAIATVASFFVYREALTRISPLRLLSTKLEPEKKAIVYPSQTISIDTPFATALTIREPIFPDHVCSITDFGAVADGTTSNTEAFKRAIESCADAGGGKVIVPPGVWLTGPIHLRSNIELNVGQGATLLFSARPEDYLPVVFSRFEGIEYYNYSPPIYAIDSTNVAVTGAGTLDGQGGSVWWKFHFSAIEPLYSMGDDDVPVAERVFGTEAAGLRPAFIEFVRSSNVLVEDVKILNGPMWTIHPVYSNNVIVRGVAVETNPGPSTDGVAVDSSTNVLVENSTFDTGDDAIVLKSGRDKEGMRLHIPTENVVIRNNTIKDAHGAIAIGSEISGDIRNVFVTGTNVETAQFGFRVKAALGRGGIVENIWVEDMRIRSATIEAIQITTSYGLPFRKESVALPLFKNIHLKNISVRKTRQAAHIDGLPALAISDISLEDMTAGTRSGVEVRNADTVRLSNIQATLKYDEPLFTVLDSAHVTIENSSCQTSACLVVHGQTSENIDARNSGFSKNKVRASTEVKPDAIVY